MCGIAGAAGQHIDSWRLESAMAAQRHRGPDDEGIYIDPAGIAGLAHNRLSIIDLSPAGHQPMSNNDGTLWLVFNGEIYNYLELRTELDDYPFQSQSDSEVILAAYQRWGEDCLDRFVGMFAFLIWDNRKRRLFAARDRFGVKPLYYHQADDGTLWLASEIRALHQAGVPRRADKDSWATYLASGHSDHSCRTFWAGVYALEPGHYLTWERGITRFACWYDLAERVGPDYDRRSAEAVQEEYLHLATQSVKLRFRSDVPVAINLSGGVDSSLLLGLVDSIDGQASGVKAYTFITGDPAYDELPWVEQMLARTRHESVICRLDAADVPELALTMSHFQDAPYGGLPTLAYGRLFQRARSHSTIVMLDGQGMDEQWAGYDYYANAEQGGNSVVQGTSESPTRPGCLSPMLRKLAEPFEAPRPFPDALRNLQYRDIRYTKIPRALRFNDSASMSFSTELREPFLDHRLFELAIRQPKQHKIVHGTRKWLLRRMAGGLLPADVHAACKRPLQTPQREWLRGPLQSWAGKWIERGLSVYGGEWLNTKVVRQTWREFCEGRSDNSFYVWQWISLAMMSESISGSVACPISRSA